MKNCLCGGQITSHVNQAEKVCRYGSLININLSGLTLLFSRGEDREKQEVLLSPES